MANQPAQTTFYQSNTSTIGTLTSCPLPLVTVTSDGNQMLLFSWMAEGVSNQTTTPTEYTYALASKQGTSAYNTIVSPTTTNATSFSYQGVWGYIYRLSITARCYSSQSLYTTSSLREIEYAIPYYFLGAGQGIEYLASCPLVTVASTSSSSNTTFTWSNAGLVGSNSNSFTIELTDTSTTPVLASQTTILQSITVNTPNDLTYTFTIITNCGYPSLPRVYIFKPVKILSAVATNTGIGTMGSLQVTSNMSGVVSLTPFGSEVVATNNTMVSSQHNFTSLYAGIYTLKVADNLNPNSYRTQTVNILTCNLTTLAVARVQPIGVNGYGSITIVNPDTTTTYRYVLTRDATTMPSITSTSGSAQFNNLVPGVYQYVVTDVDNSLCVLNGAAEIYSADLVITAINRVSPASATGFGSATIVTNNQSTTAYSVEYAVQAAGSTTTPSFSASNVFTSLLAGSYVALARYRRVNNDLYSEVIQGFGISGPAVCNLPQDSTISLTVEQPIKFGEVGRVFSDLSAYNGTKQYSIYEGDQYSAVAIDWSNSNDFVLQPGDYLYLANCTDISNCTGSSTFTINEPVCNLSGTNFTISTTPRSNTLVNGTMTILPKSTLNIIGNLVYSISLNRQNPPPAQTYTASSNTAQGHTFFGLDTGTYSINIKYDNTICYCDTIFSVSVDSAQCNLTQTTGNIANATVSVTDVTTAGGNNGTARLIMNAFTTSSPLQYLIKKDGQFLLGYLSTTQNDFAGLAYGTYEYIIRYAQQPSCYRSIPFSVYQASSCNLNNNYNNLPNIQVSKTSTPYGQSMGTVTFLVNVKPSPSTVVEYRIASTLNDLTATPWSLGNTFTNLGSMRYYYEVRYPSSTPACVSAGSNSFVIDHVCPFVQFTVTGVPNAAASTINFTWSVSPTPARFDVVLMLSNGNAAATATVATTNGNGSYMATQVLNNINYYLRVTPQYTGCTPSPTNSNTINIPGNVYCNGPVNDSVIVDPLNNTLSRFTWGGGGPWDDDPQYLFSYKRRVDAQYSAEILLSVGYYTVPIVLPKGVTYDWRVRSACASITESANNSTYSDFEYTRFQCDIPVVTTQDLPNGDVRVNVTNNEGNYYYSVKQTSTDTYPINSLITAPYQTPYFIFTPLTGASYDIRVRSLCADPSDPVSAYEYIQYSRSCPTVTNTGFNISSDNQRVNVTWNSTSSNFSCRYKETSASTSTYNEWTIVSQRIFTFTPIPNRFYTVQIQTICGNIVSSPASINVVLYRCDIIPATNINVAYNSINSKGLVSWSAIAGATSYSYTYNKKSEPTTIYTQSTGATTNFQIDPMFPNVEYRIGVRSNCPVGSGGSGGSSAYTYINYTKDECPILSGLTISENNGDATVSWVGNTNATKYLYSYSIVGSGGSTSGETTDNYFIFSTTLNRTYDISVRVVCGDVTSAATTDQYLHTFCPILSGVITTNEVGPDTIVTWAAVNNAQSYIFRYKKTGDTSYTMLPFATPSATFKPIQGAEYTLSVQIVCSALGSIVSNWSPPLVYIRTGVTASKWTGYLYDDTDGPNNGSKLPNKNVQALHVVGDDVWAGTESTNGTNGGIWHFNSLTNLAETLTTTTSGVQGGILPNNNIRSIYQSSNSLWAGTATAGLWRKDLSSTHTLGSNAVQSLALPMVNTNIIYALNKDSGNIFVINSTNDTIVKYINIPRGSYRMRFVVDPFDGLNKVYVQSERDEMLTVINAATHEVIANVLNEGGMSVSNNKAYITNFIDNSISVIDVTNNQTTELPTGYQPVSHAVVGNYVYAASRHDGNVKIINLQNQQPTIIIIGNGNNAPTQLVAINTGVVYVRAVASLTLTMLYNDGLINSQLPIQLSSNALKMYGHNDKLYVLTSNSLVIIMGTTQSTIQLVTSPPTYLHVETRTENSLTRDILYVAQDNTIAIIDGETNSVPNVVLSKYSLVDRIYKIYVAQNRVYVITERNGVHRLSILNVNTTTVLRVFALVGEVSDINFVGNKFIYITLINSKNIYTVDATTTNAAEIVLDTIAINAPVSRSIAIENKYYVQQRSGERILVIKTDNTHLDTFGFITNNGGFLSQMNNSGFRYIGAVDNMASIWLNGEMRGSVWHGGTWARGTFREKKHKGNALDYFDTAVTNTTNVQAGVWLRGVWLSGYFSYFNDLANTQDSDYYTNNGTRSIFMAIKAGSAFNQDSIFGLTTIDIENIKLDIFQNPITSDHNLSSLFARRLIKETGYPTKPYFSVFNGNFVNGIMFDDDKQLNNPSRTLLSQYATVGQYYFDKTSRDVVSALPSMNATVKESKNTVFVAPSNWTSLFYYYGQAKITNTTFLKKYYNFGESNAVWRHNHSRYGDGTSFPSAGTTIQNLPYGVSVAQGAGLEWHPGKPGEPRYDATVVEP